MGTSADGSRVFLAGTSDQNPSSATVTNWQVVTLAYDTATGATAWTTVYQAPSGFQSFAQSLAVGGSRVFVNVILESSTAVSGTTLAYDARTGALLWSVPSMVGPLAAAADGSAAYLTGSQLDVVPGQPPQSLTGTTAYAGASGAVLWNDTLQGVPGPYRGGFGIALAGGKVYTAAVDQDPSFYVEEFDLVVADAATGQVLATGALPRHAAAQSDLVVSPDGSRAYIAFQDVYTDPAGTRHSIMAVAAFDGLTGQELWLSHYLGPNPTGAVFRSNSVPWTYGSLALSPDGSRVFIVGGSSDGDGGTSPPDGSGFTTIAYSAATGAQQWVSEYNTNTPLNYSPPNVVITMDPLDRAVYVTGYADQAKTFATLAYDPATGSALATAIYAGDGLAQGMTVSPDGSRVFVGAEAVVPPKSDNDIQVIAYSTTFLPAAQVPEPPPVPAGVFAALAATLVTTRASRARRRS